MFGVILTTSFVSMRNTHHKEVKTATPNTNHHKKGLTIKKQDTSFILFDLVTDYTLSMVMLIKIYYAIICGYKMLNHGSKDEEFLFDEHGDKKWKARILSK